MWAAEFMTKFKSAIVTIAIGNQYLKFYNKYFRPSHEAFAKKIDVPLIVIDNHIDETELGTSRHPAWQKLNIFKSPLTHEFDQLCWIDADMYITDSSLNPFDLVDINNWAAVRNNIYNLDSYRVSDLELYKFCPSTNMPDYLLNTGFFIVNRYHHSKLLDYVYENYSEQQCYENGPLSYHLLNTAGGIELSDKFNKIVMMHMHVEGTSLYSTYKLVKGAYFIHFCGGIRRRILNRVIIIDFLFKAKRLFYNWLDNIF